MININNQIFAAAILALPMFNTNLSPIEAQANYFVKHDQAGTEWSYRNGYLLSVKYSSGAQYYYRGNDNNCLHSEDGPAIVGESGWYMWFLDGKQINCKTQEEFERIIKMKAFW